MEAVADAPKQRIRFKLLAGHWNYNAGTVENPKIVKHRQGDEFETHVALDEMFNSPGSIKFQRLSVEQEDTEETLEALEKQLADRRAKLKAKKSKKKEPKEESDGLESKSFAELQEIAEANNIDIGKAKNQKEVLKIIRDAAVPA